MSGNSHSGGFRYPDERLAICLARFHLRFRRKEKVPSLRFLVYIVPLCEAKILRTKELGFRRKFSYPLLIKSAVDTKVYEKGIEVTDSELASVSFISANIIPSVFRRTILASSFVSFSFSSSCKSSRIMTFVRFSFIYFLLTQKIRLALCFGCRHHKRAKADFSVCGIRLRRRGKV